MADNQKIIDKLNYALNREVSTFLRYILQSALVKGAPFESVREMYRKEVLDEVAHAQYLADKIVALGGTPKLDPDLSPPPLEVREMLKRDIEQEHVDVEGYAALAQLADESSLIELKLQMEEQAADEARHAEEMQRLLG